MISLKQVQIYYNNCLTYIFYPQKLYKYIYKMCQEPITLNV